eukprot:5587564-Pyramimonas_sp.AAC.1
MYRLAVQPTTVGEDKDLGGEVSQRNARTTQEGGGNVGGVQGQNHTEILRAILAGGPLQSPREGGPSQFR